MNTPTDRKTAHRAKRMAAMLLALLAAGLLCLGCERPEDANPQSAVRTAPPPERAEAEAGRAAFTRARDSLPPDLVVREPERQFDFFLIDERFRQARWNLSGPYREDGGDMRCLNALPTALSGDRTRLYALGGQQSGERIVTGQHGRRLQARDLIGERSLRIADLPPDFPPFSWTSAMAYDSGRDVVSVVTTGGEGFWYRYDARANRWLDHRSLKHKDLAALAHDAETDRYVAFDAKFPGGRLLFLSADGELLFAKEFRDELKAFQLDQQKRAMPEANLAIFPHGDDLALAYFAVGIPNPRFPGRRVKAVWHYNVASEQATLTYAREPREEDEDPFRMPAGVPPGYKEQRLPGGGRVLIPVMPEQRPAPVVRAPEPGRSGGLLALSDETPPRELAEGAEVIVVSGYEAADAARRGAVARVVVKRPGKKVILALTSVRAVQWEVAAGPRTEIAAILVSSPDGRSEVGVNVPSRGFRVPRLSHVTEPGNVNFVNLLAELHRLLGIDRVDALRGTYTIPPEVVVAETDPPGVELTLAGPQPQDATTSLSFSLLTPDYRESVWTLGGPEQNDAEAVFLNVRPLALSPDRTRLFFLGNDQLLVRNLDDGGTEPAELPPNFLRFAHPYNVAYDSRRDLVSVVSIGGEGSWCRYDVRAGRWLDCRSMRRLFLTSLAYDAQTDRYVGLTKAGKKLSLVFVSGEVEPLFEKRLDGKLEGLERVYDLSYGDLPGLRFFPRGDDIAVVCLSGQRPMMESLSPPQPVRAIWHYNAATESAMLTYKRGSTDREEKP